MGLEEMARKGKDKYAARKADMVTNWRNAIPTAKRHYAEVGFGPKMRRNYETGLDLGREHYTADVLDEDKWELRWLEACRAG